MTCEDAWATLMKGIGPCTHSERIAVAHHIRECPMCQEKYFELTIAELERHTPEQIKTALALEEKARQETAAAQAIDPEL